MTPKFSKQELYRTNSIVIRKSEIHGYGVFATEDIEKDDILEEVPVILYQKSDLASENTYITTYSYGITDDVVAIPMGCAGMYNHSQTPNVGSNFNSYLRIYTHFALRDIKAGEELTLDYGVGDPKVFST